MNTPTATDPCALDDPHTTLGTTRVGVRPGDRVGGAEPLVARLPARRRAARSHRRSTRRSGPTGSRCVADRRARWWRVLAPLGYSPAGHRCRCCSALPRT